jgi:hypothetical protein
MTWDTCHHHHPLSRSITWATKRDICTVQTIQMTPYLDLRNNFLKNGRNLYFCKFFRTFPQLSVPKGRAFQSKLLHLMSDSGKGRSAREAIIIIHSGVRVEWFDASPRESQRCKGQMNLYAYMTAHWKARGIGVNDSEFFACLLSFLHIARGGPLKEILEREHFQT